MRTCSLAGAAPLKGLEEVHEQRALPCLGWQGRVVQDFQKIDAVQGRVGAHGLSTALITAGVDHTAGPSARKLGDLALLGAPVDVLHRHPQGRLLAGDLHRLHLDQVAEPLLQGALHQELRCSGQFVAIAGRTPVAASHCQRWGD